MVITEKEVSGWNLVKIEGRLDTTSYPELEKKLNDLIDQQRTMILLDCTGMDYISSSGLRILLMALKKVTPAGGRFLLAGLQPNIREIFEISGFTSIFQVYSTVEEAMKSF